YILYSDVYFFFQAEDGIRDRNVTGVQTCALPIWFSDSCRSGDPSSVHADPFVGCISKLEGTGKRALRNWPTVRLMVSRVSSRRAVSLRQKTSRSDRRTTLSRRSSRSDSLRSTNWYPIRPSTDRPRANVSR